MSALDEIADWIRAAPRVAVFSGAGMSAESGVPTFRGSQSGLWRQFDPAELATAEAWRRDPELVWGWYVWRMARVRDARPHAGHLALGWLQAQRAGVSVVTQNVDDLHERGGSRDVVHLHGRVFACRCFDCGHPHGDLELPTDAADSPQLRRAPPRCAHCAGAIRPGVVWFGEALPSAAWRAATRAIGECDLLLVIGTSGVVQPAASLVALARSSGARVVEINPQTSEVSSIARRVVRQPAARALTAIRQALER